MFPNNTQRPIAHERQAVLVRELNEHGYVQVAEMAKKLNTTAITIRRDLLQLEEEGICIRKRGGAVRASQGVTLELPYHIKINSRIAEKKRIALAAIQYVNHGSTIILDTGSTTFALALLLTQKRITVVTSDLLIAVKLAACENINLICTGGAALPNVFSLQGSQVVSFIQSLRVETTFLGADAIHSNGVVSNVNLEEALIKQAMIDSAQKTILLADSTKFEKIGFARVCSLSDLDLVITDSELSQEKRDLLNAANTQFLTV